MPQTSTSTALAMTEQAAAPSSKSSLRKRLRSAGIIAVAAALVGSVALPAVALQSQESAPETYLSMASEAQTIEVETSAGLQTIDLPAVSATTQAELEEIQAEAQRVAEEEAAAAAAAEEEAAATQDASTTESVEAADESTSAPAVQDGPASASAGSIVGIAQSQLGKPYVFGATGPDAFDCSGFTQWVYSQVGVALPRDASTQASVGTPVSSPQPGDLLVWSGHVAIYVGGDTIIHAATPSSGVKYTPYSAMVASMGAPQIRRF